jgi:hypothetical protein
VRFLSKHWGLVEACALWGLGIALNYIETSKTNEYLQKLRKAYQALHRTAIPLRSIAAGELGRWEGVISKEFLPEMAVSFLLLDAD